MRSLEIYKGKIFKHRFLAVINLLSFGQEFFLGDNGEGGTPDPIPNSEVKPFLADGTAHKSVEE